MSRLLKLMRARVASERGSVGFLIALAIFLVCGMLTMTWNTVQLSKEKMRLQNAADAAALEFCIWQARGMNAIQNINDEAWVVFDTGTKLLNFTLKVETALTPIPYRWIRAIAESLLCVVPGAVSGLLTHWAGDIMLNAAAKFYRYGSCAFGLLGAQQLAAANNASGILGNWADVGDFHFGLYTIGISGSPINDFIRLPLEQEDDIDVLKKNGFLRTKAEGAVSEGILSTAVFRPVFKVCGTGKAWKFSPYVSCKKANKKSGDLGALPKPVVFISVKYANEIETMSLEDWSGNAAKTGVHEMPVFALAAAQCITGDVIVHNEEPDDKGRFKATNNRPVGFGVGATAKLVPVKDAVGAIPAVGGVMKDLAGGVIFH